MADVMDAATQKYKGVRAKIGRYGEITLQAILNYGMIIYPQHVSKNPVKVISDAKLWPEIQARTTCLEPEQFQTFHDTLLSFPAIHRDCYLFAVYQGLRPDEAHSLRWGDVDLEKKLFDLSHK